MTGAGPPAVFRRGEPVGWVTGMAALKSRRTRLLLSSDMAVMPPYRPAFRFIGRDGLAGPGGAVGSTPVPRCGGSP